MDRGFEMQIFYSFLISEEEAFGRGEKKDGKERKSSDYLQAKTVDRR